MFDLKCRQVGTVVDGDGMTKVGAEGDESSEVAGRHICQRGIIVTINIVYVSWEGEKDKDLNAGSRSRQGRGEERPPGQAWTLQQDPSCCREIINGVRSATLNRR